MEKTFNTDSNFYKNIFDDDFINSHFMPVYKNIYTYKVENNGLYYNNTRGWHYLSNFIPILKGIVNYVDKEGYLLERRFILDCFLLEDRTFKLPTLDVGMDRFHTFRFLFLSPWGKQAIYASGTDGGHKLCDVAQWLGCKTMKIQTIIEEIDYDD